VAASVLAVTKEGDPPASVTALNLVGQWSNDGQEWVDFETSMTGSDLSQAVGVNSTGPARPLTYVGRPHEMAQYVRFGAQIKRVGGTSGKPVRARVSYEVNVLAKAIAYDAPVADSKNVVASGQLGEVLCTAAFNRATLYIAVANLSGGGSITPKVQTSLSPESGGFWRDIATLTAFTANGEQTAHIVDDLDLFTRVCLTVSGSADMSAILVLRPDPAN